MNTEYAQMRLEIDELRALVAELKAAVPMRSALPPMRITEAEIEDGIEAALDAEGILAGYEPQHPEDPYMPQMPPPRAEDDRVCVDATTAPGVIGKTDETGVIRGDGTWIEKTHESGEHHVTLSHIGPVTEEPSNATEAELSGEIEAGDAVIVEVRIDAKGHVVDVGTKKMPDTYPGEAEDVEYHFPWKLTPDAGQWDGRAIVEQEDSARVWAGHEWILWNSANVGANTWSGGPADAELDFMADSHFWFKITWQSADDAIPTIVAEKGAAFPDPIVGSNYFILRAYSFPAAGTAQERFAARKLYMHQDVYIFAVVVDSSGNPTRSIERRYGAHQIAWWHNPSGAQDGLLPNGDFSGTQGEKEALAASYQFPLRRNTDDAYTGYIRYMTMLALVEATKAIIQAWIEGLISSAIGEIPTVYHNELTDLQGGDGDDQYYHLDATEHGYLTDDDETVGSLAYVLAAIEGRLDDIEAWIDDYEEVVLEYKDHNGDDQTLTVLAKKEEE